MYFGIGKTTLFLRVNPAYTVNKTDLSLFSVLYAHCNGPRKRHDWPGHHPFILQGVKQWGDRDTAELSDSAHVLGCRNRSRSQVRRLYSWSDLKYKCGDCVTVKQRSHATSTPHDLIFLSFSLPLPLPVLFFMCSSPDQVLTRTPCPGPEELPTTAWPTKEAFLGTFRGWKQVSRRFLQHVWFL